MIKNSHKDFGVFLVKDYLDLFSVNVIWESITPCQALF